MSKLEINKKGISSKIETGDFVEVCGSWCMVVDIMASHTLVSLETGFMYTKPRNSLEELQSYFEKEFGMKFEKGVTLHRTDDVKMTLNIKEGE